VGTQIDWTAHFLALVPEISLAILLVAVLSYDRLVPPGQRRRVGLLTAWGTFAILLLTVGVWLFLGQPDANATLQESLLWGGMIRHDLVTFVFRVIALIAVILTVLISLDVTRLQRGEYFALLLTATIGFSLMAASSDMIMLFLALETASISLYVLAGFLTEKRRSTEAGMKYFVYGAFASAVMLYGFSLMYGLTGSSNIYEIAFAVRGAVIPADANAVLLLAGMLILVGFGFKISAVPFHFWTPDVYEGAPAPVTAFVSTASKAAGFAILLRVFTAGMVGEPIAGGAWWSTLIAITVVTMTLGNVLAIFQSNIKRMLAYSSIAQAGYALIGLVAFTADGAGATLFYLLMYVVTNIAAFGVIVLVGRETKADEMRDFYGAQPALALPCAGDALRPAFARWDSAHSRLLRQILCLQGSCRGGSLVAGIHRRT
jgi:NADH-quinone oxidoreductase subunit N